MQGTYRVEQVVRDTPSFSTSSSNMLVASGLGIKFVRWTKFSYFLTHAHFINRLFCTVYNHASLRAVSTAVQSEGAISPPHVTDCCNSNTNRHCK